MAEGTPHLNHRPGVTGCNPSKHGCDGPWCSIMCIWTEVRGKRVSLRNSCRTTTGICAVASKVLFPPSCSLSEQTPALVHPSISPIRKHIAVVCVCGPSNNANQSATSKCQRAAEDDENHETEARAEQVLSQIPITRHSGLLHALEVLPLDERLDALLDHVDVRLELRRQLRDRLAEQLRVGEVFALSVFSKVSNRHHDSPKGKGETYFIIRTTAASIAKPRESLFFFSVSFLSLSPSTLFPCDTTPTRMRITCDLKFSL